MKKKMALASASLLLMLTAFLPPVSAPDGVMNQSHIVMGGTWNSTALVWIGPLSVPPELWPFATREPWITPMQMGQDVTFSDPDPVTGVITLTVPAATYIGLDHIFWSGSVGTYLWFTTFMVADGFGWLFTGTGTSPILGDVDVYTFNNYTGVYWGPPSQLVGQLAAATGGSFDDVAGDFDPPMAERFPNVGVDGLPGTADDGFGDGVPDPPGSSILMLPTVIDVWRWNPDLPGWEPLIFAPLPLIMTTGTAYDIIIDPVNTPDLNGIDSTEVGEPWEFVASGIPWGDPECNVTVTYATAWSLLNYTWEIVDEVPYRIDLIYDILEKKVRDDFVIADINCDERVDIFDIVICAVAFGAMDEGFGFPVADPNFDARADLNGDSVIDIFDIVMIAIDYGVAIGP